MMNTLKKIYLIRHAKAEEHSFQKSDYNRSLIEKGKDRASRIANRLEDEIDSIERTRIISSSANRAKETASIFAKELGWDINHIQLVDSIYEAPYTDILKVINDTSNDCDNLLIFGHNPGLSDLANYLCNTYISMNTSAVAIILIEEGLQFEHVSQGTGTLVKVLNE